MIVSILNQKGGSGKTTIATNIARALQIGGADVLLVDADPQGSARDWAVANENQPVPVVALDRPQLLKNDIKKISQPYEWVIVDGAPQLQEMAASCICSSDIILIPVQPSPYDIWSCADLVDTIKARQALTDNGYPKAFFVVSRMIKGTSLAADIVETLKDYEFESLENMTVQRQIYAKSAVSGLSVIDVDSGGKAAKEIMAIVKELKSIEL